MRDQTKTPYFTALKKYTNKNIAPFDVPGHKRGEVKNEMVEFIGVNTFKMDSNAPKGMDTLSNPRGVIREAESLAANAFGADYCFFLTGGTTQGILAMLMLAVKAKEKIIVPRNVHKSVINGLILSGGIPIFIKPDMDINLGIANGISYDEYKRVIDENLDAVAILLINPTYFGVCNDIKKITEYAHNKNMLVLVDEAHGGNLYFCDDLPLSAMEAGADIAAVSTHKSLGSLTQSSMLLVKGEKVDILKLRATLNIIGSTSPSQLLIASLDVARKNIVLNKDKLLEILAVSKEIITKINTIPGIHAYDKFYFKSVGAFNYDSTRIVLDATKLGFTGFMLFDHLVNEYDIQMELAENKIVLATLSLGTTKEHLDRLVEALKDLSDKYYGKENDLQFNSFFVYPETFTRPREAYHAPYKEIKISDALNCVSAESIMAYPPGIPLVIPGEIISAEIIAAIKLYEFSDSTILSETKPGYVKVIDLDNWEKP